MKYTLLFFTLLINVSLYSQKILIFGGDDHEVFLGCMNCNKYDKNSIWNEYGDYGNHFNLKSIWNEYGTYGNEFSSYSPFNEYANNPPVLVDREGNFYGYFTINEYHSKRTQNKLALFILDFWEAIRKDVDKYYDKIFNP